MTLEELLVKDKNVRGILIFIFAVCMLSGCGNRTKSELAQMLGEGNVTLSIRIDE